LAGGTLNGGMEIAIAKQWSIDISGYWNPIKTKNFSIRHTYIQPSVRWWLYEHFAGHFIALQVAGGYYDIGKSDYHTKGWFTGLGTSYGYTWLLSKQWNLTAEGGIGFFFIKNKKLSYFVDDWEPEIIRHSQRIVLYPSKVELSLTYLF